MKKKAWRELSEHKKAVITIAAFVAFILLILVPLQLYVSHRLNIERDRIISTIEERYNIFITFENTSSAFLSYFELRNVLIERREEPYSFTLNINRLRFAFNLWPLLFGQSPALEIIRSVGVNRADFHVVNIALNEQDDTLIDRLAGGEPIFDLNLFFDNLFATLNAEIDHILPPLLIAGRHINVSYTTASGLFEVNDLLLNIAPTTYDRLTLALTAGVHLNFNNFFTLNGAINARGFTTSNLSMGDFQLSANNVASNFLFLGNQGLHILWGGNLLEVRKNIDHLPLDYLIRIDSLSQTLFGYFSASNFVINDFFSFDDITLQDMVSSFSFLDGSASFLYYHEAALAIYDLDGQAQLMLNHNPLNLTLNMAGNNVKTQVRNFNVNYGQHLASFNGEIDLTNFFPSGTLILQTAINNEPLRVVNNFINHDSHLELQTGAITLGGQNLAQALTIFNFDDNVYTVSSQLNQVSNPVPLSFFAHYDVSSRIGNFNLFTSRLDLSFLNGLLPAFVQNLSLSYNINGSLVGSQFNIDGYNIELTAGDNQSLSLAFSLNNNNFSLHNLQLLYGNFGLGLNLNSTVSLQPSFTGNLITDVLSYPFSGNFSDNLLNIDYNYGHISFDTLQNTLEAGINDMVIGGDLLLNFSAEAQLAGQESSAALHYLRLNNNQLNIQLNDGNFGLNSGRINQIVFSDNISQLSGSADYTRLANGYEALVTLSGGQGELYRAQVFYTDIFAGNLVVQNFPLTRLNVPELDGLASLNLTVDNSDGLAALGDVTVSGWFNNNRLQFYTGFNYSPARVALNSISAQYGVWLTYGGSFVADFNENFVRFSTEVGHFFNYYRTSLAFYLQEDNPSGPSSFNSFLNNNFSGLVEMGSLQVKGRTAFSASRIAIARQGHNFRLTGREGIDLDVFLNLAAQQLNLNIFNKDGLSLFANANFSEESFNIDVSHFAAPLPMFNPFLLRGESNRLLGFERGTITGSLNINHDRLINGAVNFNNSALVSPFSPGTRLLLNHSLLIENNVITTGEGWRFNVNRNIFTLQIEISLNLPSFIYTINLNVDGDRGIPFAFGIGNQVRFSGNATGWAQLQGNEQMGFLSGRLNVPFGQGGLGNLAALMGSDEDRRVNPTIREVRPGYTFIASPNRGLNTDYFNGLRSNFIGAGTSSQNDTTGLFTIVSGNDFSFFVPSVQLPIISTTFAPGQQANLMLEIVMGGQGFAYMEADLRIRRGWISYANSTFNIRDGGVVQLNEQIGFNPMLIFDADLRLPSANNQIITMHFANQAVDDYDPTFSATPAMTNNQILVALGATFLPSLQNVLAADDDFLQNQGFNNNFVLADDEATVSEVNALNTMAQLGGDLLNQYAANAFANLLRNITFVDVISIRTNLVSNLILNQLNPEGFTTDEELWRSLIEGSSIYAGWYFNNQFSLQGSLGAGRGDDERIEPTIGLSALFNTPFFMAEMSIGSNFANNQTGLFINDVSLTLSRSITFRSWAHFWSQLIGRE
ncbi:MAG: hypothetical protein FWE37_03890 [Spirochaetaceae bacterium]|nr:hypothetical protein [Spirochaetaceae bacterium]